MQLLFNCLLLFIITSEGTLLGDDEKMRKIKADCAKETKVDVNLAAKLEDADPEDTNLFDLNAKCYVSCVMEKADFAKSGPPSLDSVKKFLDFTDDKGFVEIAKKCWAESKSKPDKCETKFVLFKCIMSNSKKTLKGMDGDKKEDDKEDEAKKSEAIKIASNEPGSAITTSENTTSTTPANDGAAVGNGTAQINPKMSNGTGNGTKTDDGKSGGGKSEENKSDKSTSGESKAGSGETKAGSGETKAGSGGGNMTANANGGGNQNGTQSGGNRNQTSFTNGGKSG